MLPLDYQQSPPKRNRVHHFGYSVLKALLILVLLYLAAILLAVLTGKFDTH